MSKTRNSTKSKKERAQDRKRVAQAAANNQQVSSEEFQLQGTVGVEHDDIDDNFALDQDEQNDDGLEQEELLTPISSDDAEPENGKARLKSFEKAKKKNTLSLMSLAYREILNESPVDPRLALLRMGVKPEQIENIFLRMALLSSFDPQYIQYLLDSTEKGKIKPDLQDKVDQVFALAGLDIAMNSQLGINFKISVHTSKGETFIPDDFSESLDVMYDLDKQNFVHKPHTLRYHLNENSYTEFDGKNYEIYTRGSVTHDTMVTNSMLILEQMRGAGHTVAHFNDGCSIEFVKAMIDAQALVPAMQIDLLSLSNTGLSDERIQEVHGYIKTREEKDAKAAQERHQEIFGNYVDAGDEIMGDENELELEEAAPAPSSNGNVRRMHPV